MSIWQTRDEATQALSESLKEESQVLNTSFELLDECVSVLEKKSGHFPLVSAIALVKGRNLSLGIYSLVLDGLAQESGALLRPLIEVIELLIYFQHNPIHHADLAFDRQLPKAGEISKLIKGKLKDLRDHLNQHASHFGFSRESTDHLFKTFSLRLVQPYNSVVFRDNLASLFVVITGLLQQGNNCVSIVYPKEYYDLAVKIELNKNNGIKLFYPKDS